MTSHARKVESKYLKILVAHSLGDMLQVSRSMKTCLNISVTSWPTMPVAQATRHSRTIRGYVFSLGLSLASIGKQPEGNLDGHGVGR